MEPAKVRVARCRDNAEAALVRALLGAHEIDVVISGEHHAAMLGGLAGPFLSLDVWVDREEAERATELIQQMREGVELEPDDRDDADDTGPVRHWGIEQRRRTGVVLLLSCVVTFGTGHCYAGAWLRGALLAAVEVVGFTQVPLHPALGASLIVIAVATDLVGALLLVRRSIAESRLPSARLRR